MTLVLYLSFYILFLISRIGANISALVTDQSEKNEYKKESTLPTRQYLGDSLLFVSALDGTLHAVNGRTGSLIWNIKEDPVLRMPINNERGTIFFASPVDGSLYTFKVGLEGLKKLPFTIPDLVTVTPCKSHDGLLYTGYKKDSWILVDLITGHRQHVLTHEGTQETCPSNTPTTIFIGRTEYSVAMFDGTSRQISWNVTFIDYSSHLSLKQSHDSNIKHFASSSDGSLVTMDANTGRILWSRKFESPVVGIYSLNGDRALERHSFISIGHETLAHLSEKGLVGSEWADKFSLAERFKESFLPTLYIGEYRSSSYALLSFVDASSVIVAPKNFGRPLLEGPKSTPAVIGSLDSDAKQSIEKDVELVNKTDEVFLIGHHEVPDVLTNEGAARVPTKLLEYKALPISFDTISNSSAASRLSSDLINIRNESNHIYVIQKSHDWTAAFSTLIMSLIILVIGYFYMKKTHEKAHTVHAEKLGEGTFRVGKIEYNINDILGQGCQGTLVFRGKFEGREVAVKRLLSNLAEIANREVNLLQISDNHTNVVRYFAMEKDHQFNYIALELCPMTLQDVVATNVAKDSSFPHFDSKDVLSQMLSGVAHLHKLNIVHRDIKPQNVLLSNHEGDNRRVRAMISDFGLCRKMPYDRSSVSNVPGMAGTHGWMAPEMLDPNLEKITKAVDVFSTGLVMFYVFTMGSHPFGESLACQSRISTGDCSFEKLAKWSDHITACDLIEKTISHVPSERLAIESAILHPALWSCEKQLKFFEAVSDRLEKLPDDNPLVKSLDENQSVVRKSWPKAVSKHFFDDSKKFRSYKGYSVRDLIRFIRNKRHHYHELPEELKQEIGGVPDGFTAYFTNKFPGLLLHSYRAMENCNEVQLLRP